MELLQEKDLVVAGMVHDLNLAAKFARQIVLMHQGKVLASGSREETLTAEHIRAAYRLEPVIRKKEGNLHLFF